MENIKEHIKSLEQRLLHTDVRKIQIYWMSLLLKILKKSEVMVKFLLGTK